MGRLIMCKAAHAINIKLMNMKFRASLPLYIVFQVSKQVLMMNGNKIPSITRKVFTDNNIKFKSISTCGSSFHPSSVAKSNVLGELYRYLRTNMDEANSSDKIRKLQTSLLTGDYKVITIKPIIGCIIV